MIQNQTDNEIFNIKCKRPQIFIKSNKTIEKKRGRKIVVKRVSIKVTGNEF